MLFFSWQITKGFNVTGHISMKSPTCGAKHTKAFANCRQDKEFECGPKDAVYIACESKVTSMSASKCVGLASGMRGECMDIGTKQCPDGYWSAFRMGMKGKCSDGKTKCCVHEDSIDKAQFQ